MTTTRYLTLDALRGFAVMGILAMNIVAFAMPEWAYITPKAYGGVTLADQAIWFVNFVFVDGKMRGLFSLLFGASMMLIIERAEASGQNGATTHYRRMFWLALFGLAHYFLIWVGDILFLYAIVGAAAFLFHRWRPHDLIKWALIIYLAGFLLWGIQFGGLQVLQYLATMPGADSETASLYRDMVESLQFNLDVTSELALHRGPWWPIVIDKLADWAAPLSLVVQSITETLPLMMIGMAMQKNGFITGSWDRAEYTRWTRRLVPAGLLLSALLGGWIWAAGFDPITALGIFMSWNAIPRLITTIGYAALLVLLINRFADAAFIARVAATGRVAFTNYLGTSIVMTSVFYGYGLGLYGHVSRLGLWAFVVAAWAVMLLWSKPWLARFHYGPLEWLWRSLAKMKLQPFTR